MRDWTRHLVSLIAGGLLVGSALSVSGCRLIQKEDAGELDGIEIIDAQSPEADLDRRGIDVRLMVVDDTDYDAPRALNAYPALSDERVRLQWERWGYRLIEVPSADVEGLLGSLRPVQPVSVKWMGEFGQWRPIVRTGQINQSRVRVGESSATLASGRPSLVARSWVEPVLTQGGVEQVVRLDLVIQIEHRRQNQFRVNSPTNDQSLDERGDVIDELLSSVTLREGTAIVIIGEAPGADWAMLPEPRVIEPIELDDGQVGPDADSEDNADPADEQTTTQPPFTGESAAAQSSIGVMEPRVPQLRSLGELMLTAPGSRTVRANEARTVPQRVLIVINPEIQQRDEVVEGTLVNSGGAS